MTVFNEITYDKKIETGKISIQSNEDYNSILRATGRLPRKKDIINALELLYIELNKEENANKLDTFIIEIKSKRSCTKKRHWSKNRKNVWSYKPGMQRENFFKRILDGLKS